jgi:hypothetical protein
MTDRTPKLAYDGYSKRTTLSEGYVRKGGTNADKSQIQNRPAGPASMKPGGTSQTTSTQGGGNKQGK